MVIMVLMLNMTWSVSTLPTTAARLPQQPTTTPHLLAPRPPSLPALPPPPQGEDAKARKRKRKDSVQHPLQVTWQAMSPVLSLCQVRAGGGGRAGYDS